MRLFRSSQLLNPNLPLNQNPPLHPNPLLNPNVPPKPRPPPRSRHERYDGESASKNRRRGGSRRRRSFDEGAGGIQHWTIRKGSPIRSEEHTSELQSLTQL